MSDDDWMDDELLGILTKKRPKRRWWAVAARPIPPSTQTGPAPPLDSLPATFGAYSFRKISTAYAGMCMNVQRSSDSISQDIGFSASGDFDVAGFNAFVGAGTGACGTWYDQSGNGNNLAFNTTRPTINLTGINGKPGVVIPAIGTDLQIALVQYGQPWTDSAVALRNGRFTGESGIFGDQNPQGSGLYFTTTANTVQNYAGTLGTAIAATDGVAHSIIGIYNGASSSMTVDGATTSGFSVGSNFAFGIKVGNIGGNQLIGIVAEGIRWPSGTILSAANITTLATNQKAYWGTP